MNKTFFKRAVASALAAFMVVTSVPETALVADAAAPTAPKITYSFFDADGITPIDSTTIKLTEDTLKVVTPGTTASSLKGLSEITPGSAIAEGTYYESSLSGNTYWEKSTISGSGADVYTKVTPQAGDALATYFTASTPAGFASGDTLTTPTAQYYTGETTKYYAAPEAASTITDADTYGQFSGTLYTSGTTAFASGETLTLVNVSSEAYNASNHYYTFDTTPVNSTLDAATDLSGMYTFTVGSPKAEGVVFTTSDVGKTFVLAGDEGDTLVEQLGLHAATDDVYGLDADVTKALPAVPESSITGYSNEWELFGSYDNEVFSIEEGNLIIDAEAIKGDYTVNQTCTVKIRVKAVLDQYNVNYSFNLNGGKADTTVAAAVAANKATVDAVPAGKTVVDISSLNASKITKDGYYFAGWKITGTDKDKFVINESNVVVTKEALTGDCTIALEAQWKKSTVNFTIANGAGYDSIKVTDAVDPKSTDWKTIDLKKTTAQSFEFEASKPIYVVITPLDGYSIAYYNHYDTKGVVDGEIFTETGAGDPFVPAVKAARLVTADAETYLGGLEYEDDATKPQVYEISNIVSSTPVNLTISNAAVAGGDITITANTENSDSEKKVGGTSNPIRYGKKDAAKSNYSGAISASYTDTYEVTFKVNDGFEYSVSVNNTGADNVVVGTLSEPTGENFKTVTFTFTKVKGNATITINEVASGKSVAVTAAAESTDDAAVKAKNFKTSVDGENWVDGASAAVPYGSSLYVQFEGANGYVYTPNITGDTATVDKTSVNSDGKVELVKGTNDDGDTIYVGIFKIDNIYDTTAVELDGDVGAKGTVSFVAGEGTNKVDITTLQLSSDNGTTYTSPGTVLSYKANMGATNYTYVKFAAKKDTFYTVTVDGDNAKVSATNKDTTTDGKSSVVVSKETTTATTVGFSGIGAGNIGTAGDYYAVFKVMDVAGDAVITITPSTNYTVKVVDDKDNGGDTLMTFTLEPDQLSATTSLGSLITDEVNKGATFNPVKEGYYFVGKVYNQATETATAAGTALADVKMTTAFLTGTETTFVVMYSPVQYNLFYFDRLNTKEVSGKTVNDFDEAKTVKTTGDPAVGVAAQANIEYLDKDTVLRAGKGGAGVTASEISTAISNYVKGDGTGRKFAEKWDIYEALYYNTNGVRVYNIAAADSNKTEYAKIWSNYADNEILPNDLSITHGGSVYMIPVYEDVNYTFKFDSNIKSTTNTNGYVVADVSGSMSPVVVASSKLTSTTIAESGFKAPGWEVKGWKINTGVATDLETIYTSKVSAYNAAISEKANTGVYPAEVTLYAVWEESTYDITYHANGGNVAGGSPVSYKYTADANIPNATITTAGYKFAGWFLDEEFKKEVATKADGSYYIPAKSSTGNIDLYAKWVAETYTITFHPGYTEATAGEAGTMPAQNIKTNIPVTLTKNAFKRTDYSFAGWAKTEGGAVEYLDGDTATFQSGQDLYAVWSKSGDDVEITINFTKAGAKLAATAAAWTVDGDKATAKTKVGGAYPTLPTNAELTFDNYKLTGWKLSGSGKEINTIDGMSGKFALDAVWTGDSHTVTYLNNAATLSSNTKVTGKMNPVTVEYGTTWMPLDCEYVANGYTFLGWSEKADATVADNSYSAPKEWNSKEDLTLYAIWSPVGETLTLYSGYGSVDTTAYKLGSASVATTGNIQTFSYTYKDVAANKVTLPTAAQMDPDANGLKFAGWFKTGYDIYGDPTYKPTGKKVTKIALGDENAYVAKWTGKYTITYHIGTEEVEQSRTMGKSTALKAPSKKLLKEFAGFRFAGWDTNSNAATVEFQNKQKITNETLNDVLGNEPELLDYDLYAVFEAVATDYNYTIQDSEGGILETGTFAYKKGITAKNLTKIGKELSSNFSHFTNLSGKKISKIAKKTAGDQILVLNEKSPVTKVKLVFNKNADKVGVKVTGSVSKKTVRSTDGIVTGVSNFKAAGYDLLGYSTNSAAVVPTYYIAPNGGMYTLAGFEHNGAHIAANGSGTKITLYAIWKSATTSDHIDYYNIGYAQNTAANCSMTNYSDTVTTTLTDVAGNSIYTDSWDETVMEDMKLHSSLPAPTRAGYKFTGWTEQNVKGDFVVTTAANTGAYYRYLVATWAPVE